MIQKKYLLVKTKKREYYCTNPYHTMVITEKQSLKVFCYRFIKLDN